MGASSVVGDLFGGRFGGVLPQLASWVAVAGLLAVIATALISLAHDASRTSRIGRRPTAIVPEVKQPPPRVCGTPSSDSRWVNLVEECVEVIDELDQNADDFDAPPRELAEHVVLRLEEALERSGVEVIKDEPSFDRARHSPVPRGGTPPAGATISATLNPGFAVGRRVLRRARVRIK